MVSHRISCVFLGVGTFLLSRPAGPRGWRMVVHHAVETPAARAIRATRTSSIPCVEMSSQATSRIRSRRRWDGHGARGDVVGN